MIDLKPCPKCGILPVKEIRKKMLGKIQDGGYTVIDGRFKCPNFFNEWLAITIYKHQYLFVPTFAVFRTTHNRDWRIGFNWLNFAISIRVKPPKEET